MGARKTRAGWRDSWTGKGSQVSPEVPPPKCEGMDPGHSQRLAARSVPVAGGQEQGGREGLCSLEPPPWGHRTRSLSWKPPTSLTRHRPLRLRSPGQPTPADGGSQAGGGRAARVRTSASLTFETGPHRARSPPLCTQGSSGEEVTDSPSVCVLGGCEGGGPDPPPPTPRLRMGSDSGRSLDTETQFPLPG